MKRLAAVVVFAVCLIGVSFADDPKKPEDPAPKAKLPIHWSKLGLSDKQKADYNELYRKHHAVIADLEKKLADEKALLKSDEDKLLTDDQKKALKAIILKESAEPTKDKAPVKDKEPVKDKP